MAHTIQRNALVGVSVVAMSLSMTACGGKKHASSAANAATKATSSATKGGSSAKSKASSSASGASSKAGSGSCSGQYKSATIGGAHKCIMAGQECSHSHASDYGKFGFTCEKKGNRYVLSKA